MLASSKRGRGRPRGDRSPFSSPYTALLSSPAAARRGSLEERRRPAANFNTDVSPAPDVKTDEHEDEEELEEEDEGDEDEDGEGDTTPLLPIFSAAHLGIRFVHITVTRTCRLQWLTNLDSLPVYNLTHAIRLLVAPRCETTLSWDQLRSPQVSQFLVKPIQQQIRNSHFSRATLYALMANCLQFNKEVQMNPGNSGASKTRSMVCELLAIKLLKEFSTRELVSSLYKSSARTNVLIVSRLVCAYYCRCQLLVLIVLDVADALS